MGSLLSTYLNDHLAMSTAGVELVRRAQKSNRESGYEQTLDTLAGELAQDRRELERVMSRLGVGKDRAKLAMAWTGEKLGRLKPNNQLTGYSPLSRLVELEGLALVVESQLVLWQALIHTHGTDKRLADVDLRALQERARSQQRALERQRRAAAEEALGEAVATG